MKDFVFAKPPDCSLGRWWTGWYVSALKNLSSNHALKPLIPTFCFLVVIIYSQADKLRNFVAGIFIPQYHYSFPVALCFTQVSKLQYSCFQLISYSRSLGERLLLPAICNSVHSVLVTWAKASSPYTSLFFFTVPLLPLLTGLLYLLSAFSFFLSTASKGISGNEPLEYFYAPLALILHSLSLIGLAKVSEAERHQPPDVQASVFDIYYAQLVNQSGVLGLLWVLHPDNPCEVLRLSSWRNLLFHGYLLAIVLLGMVLNFFVCISALCVSPLAAALLYSARYMTRCTYYGEKKRRENIKLKFEIIINNGKLGNNSSGSPL
uniref:Si:ch211-207n2.7 n=1 Tax=Fundulus heteroclitus TaxID=8078 RepID=A0A3Q2Q4M6_FUNHE